MNESENFWDAVVEDERPLSHRDVSAPVPLVTKTGPSLINRLRSEIIRAGGALRSPTGDLHHDLAEMFDIGLPEVRALLRKAVGTGEYDIVKADDDRVYAVKMAETKTVTSVPAQPAPADPRSLPERFEISAPDAQSERIAAAIAEAMWLRYEQAVGEVGRLMGLLVQRDELIVTLQRQVESLRRSADGMSVREMAEAMLEHDIDSS